jgi:hypothetical protein
MDVGGDGGGGMSEERESILTFIEPETGAEFLDLRTDGRVFVRGRLVVTDEQLCAAIWRAVEMTERRVPFARVGANG